MFDYSRVFTFPINKKVGVGGAVEFPNHMIVNMEASIWNHMNTIEHHKNDREPIWFSNMITTEPCNVTGMMVRYRVTSANGMNFSGLVNCYILSRYISETNHNLLYFRVHLDSKQEALLFLEDLPRIHSIHPGNLLDMLTFAYIPVQLDPGLRTTPAKSKFTFFLKWYGIIWEWHRMVNKQYLEAAHRFWTLLCNRMVTIIMKSNLHIVAKLVR